jgi:hypothetical protein
VDPEDFIVFPNTEDQALSTSDEQLDDFYNQIIDWDKEETGVPRSWADFLGDDDLQVPTTFSW